MYGEFDIRGQVWRERCRDRHVEALRARSRQARCSKYVYPYLDVNGQTRITRCGKPGEAETQVLRRLRCAGSNRECQMEGACIFFFFFFPTHCISVIIWPSQFA